MEWLRKLVSSVSSRIELWWGLFFRGWWRPVVILIGVVSFYDLILGQFIPSLPTITEFINSYFPVFTWRIWVFILMALVLLAVLEGSYRRIKSLEGKLEKITTQRLELSLADVDKKEYSGMILGASSQEWYRIRVHNPTVSPIRLCYGKLDKLESKLPYPNLPSSGIMFPWTSYGGREKLTTIAGHDSDLLDIIVFDGRFISVVVLDDATGNRDLSRFPLLIDDYDLIVRIGTQDEAFPPSCAIIRIKPYVENFEEHLAVTLLNYNPDCCTRLE